MNRRSLLSLLFIALLMAPNIATAQSATPSASPIAGCKPFPFCIAPGFEARVWRTYERVESSNYYPAELQFGIAEYDSEDAAHAALPVTLMRAPESIPSGQDASGVRLTSLEPIGDESFAVSGIVKQASGKSYYAAYVMVRTGKYIRFGYGWEWNGNPLADVADILNKTTDLLPSNAPVTKDPFGVSHGGLWEAVPSLSQIPLGYQVAAESN